MFTLPSTFTIDGFSFKLLDRAGDAALFEKRKVSIDSAFYEVVIVQKTGDHTWPDGRTTPAHEHMPHSEQWGTLGWTLQTKERAFEKFKEITEKLKP